jgi:hypothetical protein
MRHPAMYGPKEPRFYPLKNGERMKLRLHAAAVAVMVATAFAALAASGASASAATATHAGRASATAATTAHAGSQTGSVLSPGTHGGLSGRAIPRIRWRSCYGQTTTWVKIVEFDIRVPGSNDWCFGYTGTWYFDTQYIRFSQLCAGNNYGDVDVIYNGSNFDFPFEPGTIIHWPSYAKAISLTITSWYGGNTCR